MCEYDREGFFFFRGGYVQDEQTEDHWEKCIAQSPQQSHTDEHGSVPIQDKASDEVPTHFKLRFSQTK